MSASTNTGAADAAMAEFDLEQAFANRRRLKHVKWSLSDIAIFEKRLERYLTDLPSPRPRSHKREPWEVMRCELVRRLAKPVLDGLDWWVRKTAPEVGPMVDLAGARELLGRGAPSAAAAELRALAWGLRSHAPARYGRAMVVAEIAAMLVRVSELFMATSAEGLGNCDLKTFEVQDFPPVPIAVSSSLSILVEHLERHTPSPDPVKDAIQPEPLLYPHLIVVNWAARSKSLRYARQLAGGQLGDGAEWEKVAGLVERLGSVLHRLSGGRVAEVQDSAEAPSESSNSMVAPEDIGGPVQETESV